jgi:ribosomal protein S11
MQERKKEKDLEGVNKNKNMVRKRKYKLQVRKNFKFKFLIIGKEKGKGKRKSKDKRKPFRIKIGYLIFKQVHSNYFLTFADKKFHTIICVSSGNSKVGDSIRKKISPYAMENITRKLVPYLKLYKLKYIHLYLHTRPRAGFFTLIHQLKLKRIRIHRISERIHVPHNGIRRRKPRRK